MSSQGLGTAFEALTAFSTDATFLTIALIFVMLSGTFLPLQCCCKKKRKRLVRQQPVPAETEAPSSQQQQTVGRQSGVKKVVKKPSEKSSKEKKEGSKSKSIKGPEMIDERKEEQQKRLAQTAVGLPKMKDDKHDTGMADGGGYMTLDTLDQNIFVRNLPKLTPKLGPPKMVDEAPDQKGVADGAEYQTLGKLNMNIFKTAKIEKKKKKKSKKKSKSETNLTQDTDEKTDETEHTEAESSVERTKSEEKSLAKNKKKKKKKTSKNIQRNITKIKGVLTKRRKSIITIIKRAAVIKLDLSQN
ncbi:hypothetical protein ACQ4LE_000707 [Meloidogyne hapla]